MSTKKSAPKMQTNEAAYKAAVAYGYYQAFGLVMRTIFLGLPMIAVGIFLLTLKDNTAKIMGGALLALGIMLSAYSIGKAVLIRKNPNFAAAVGGVGMARDGLGGVGGGRAYGVQFGGGGFRDLVGGIADIADIAGGSN